MKAAGPKWYVAHTYSGYEQKVKASLEKIVENRGMCEKILDIQIPIETVTTKDGDKEKTTEHRIFPCYVYIKMIMSDETWHAVRNITGVTGFVGPGSKPTPLSDQEVAALAVEQVEKVELAYQVGDTVEIKRGLMEGNRGVVQSISEDQKIITVLVNRGRRDMAFEVSADDVGRVAQ